MSGQKYLIIHMDDIGINDGANEAARHLFEIGTVTSASVIIPGRAAHEFVRWWCCHPVYDVGIHSAVTCEWDNLRWGTVCDKKEVPSVIDGDGFMVKGSKQETGNISAIDYTKETIAQIKKACEWGLVPTHLDNHMWTVSASNDMLAAYLGIARQYKLVPHIPGWNNFNETRANIVKISNFKQVDYDYTIPNQNEEKYEFKKEFLLKLLGSLSPGLSVLTIHPSVRTEEAMHMVRDCKNRVEEYRLFLEREVAEALKENDIVLTDWKQAGEKQAGERKKAESVSTERN